MHAYILRYFPELVPYFKNIPWAVVQILVETVYYSCVTVEQEVTF